MKINHVAIWVQNIDRVCEFYSKYLEAAINPLYQNPAKGFASKFVTFDGGTCLEVMHRDDTLEPSTFRPQFGYAHIAISFGSKQAVNELTI
ncbi:MAG: hypothetical protein MJY82_08680 [Fibrobacter sp.]|nr:hypothetical protein [Fibrobacter sp.]